MFDYDAERLRDVILEITRSNIPSEAWIWLHDKLGIKNTSSINAAFSMMPRRTGKNIINIQQSEADLISAIKPGYSINGWTADRLCRVCFLVHLDPTEKEIYFKTIENLFLAAEMAELVALYSALPLFAYPEMWKMRCAEGIRSNIALVLEAIMYHNPYPATHLDEKAWNQLVLKAFFTDKDVDQIYGFDERANAELTQILSDYAHERWAAGRSVNPLLWRATSKFIDQRILDDLKKVLDEGDDRERRAVALTIYNSGSEEAMQILDKYPELTASIDKQKPSWNGL